MPLYQLFAIAKPHIPLSTLAVAMKKVGTAVFQAGGVITEIKSYGEQNLAYEIRAQTGKYSTGQMFLMNFMVRPTILKDIDHDLKVNEDLLRWVVLKEQQYERLPRTMKELTRMQAAVTEMESTPYPPVPEDYDPNEEDLMSSFEDEDGASSQDPVFPSS